MPGLDRTGPMGQGSRTGKQMGKCSPHQENNEDDRFENWEGKGAGRGLGRGPGRGGRGPGRGGRGPGQGAGRGIGRGAGRGRYRGGD